MLVHGAAGSRTQSSSSFAAMQKAAAFFRLPIGPGTAISSLSRSLALSLLSQAIHIHVELIDEWRTYPA